MAWQRRLLALGATYDGLFGLAMLGAAGETARLLRVALPGDRTYFHLCGVLLLILAGLYLLASREAAWAIPVGWVAGVGRLLGATVLAAHADSGVVFAVAAGADAVLGGAHLAASWWAVRERAA